MEAAEAIGSKINCKFHWPVDLKNCDIEIVVHIDGCCVWIGVAANRKSLHFRNITHRGPTTLRATVCHNMLRMAQLVPGRTVCDPMCGCGSIPIEAALSWPGLNVIAGDNHHTAVEKSLANIAHIDASLFRSCVDVLQWDATRLPLLDSSLDAIVVDLPFGKRMGSKEDNRMLYPLLLLEWARVVRKGGRLVVLTYDKQNIYKCVHCKPDIGKLWSLAETRYSNIGGLKAIFYVMIRK